MPEVFNAKSFDGRANGAIFIGRPSKWGNPYVIGRDGTREEVVRLYAERLELLPHLKAAAVEELKGKNLLCFCAPEPCHGNILLKVANADKENNV